MPLKTSQAKMDLNKMKVNDLKAELQARGLDTKGVKVVLVERLKEAMEKENAGGAAEVSTPTVTAASKKLDVGTPNLSTPVRRSRRRSMTRSPSPVKTEVTPLDSVSEEPEQAEPSEEAADSAADSSSVRKKRRTRSITKSPSPVKQPNAEKRLDVLEEVKETENASAPVTTTASPAAAPAASSPPKSVSSKPESPTKAAPATPTKSATASPAAPKAATTPTSATKQQQQQSTPKATPEKPTAELEPEKMEESESDAKPEEVKADVANASATDSIVEGEGEDTNGGNEEEEETNATEDQSADTSVDKGKSDAENKDSNNKPKKAPTPIEFSSEEMEPEIDGGKFGLSWIDSHLNLEINSNSFDTAKPLSDGALAMAWAGARANLGVRKGKVAYEVLLTHTNAMHKVTEELVTAEFRAGWSTTEADLLLGESKHSFAYGSDGQKATDCTFTDYGAQYKVNDVLGVYLDLESTPCKIEYTLNGASQGVAFEFELADLNGQAMFPHVYSKNIAFKVNFGQLERSLLNDRKPEKAKEQPKPEKQETEDDAGDKQEATDVPVEEEKKSEGSTEDAATEPAPKEAKPQEENKEPETESKSETEPQAEQPKEEEPKAIDPDYIYIAAIDKENLVEGIARPESRGECEVIFMIGMPSSGKTHWVKNYLAENPDKRYTVLSVDSLLSQMKVSGKPRLPSNTGKWPKLVDTLAKNLNKLNEAAAKRRRNFILDQTNTFASEQKRRLRVFGGFAARRAIVVIPDEEEYNRRLKQKQDTYGVEVPEGQVNVMKAHCYLPTLELGWFTEITYVELEEEKAREMVQKMNEAGRKLVPRGGYNRNQNQYQNRGRGGGNHQQQQRWNQGYGGNNRYGGQQYQQGGGGGYNAQRYNNNAQQYSQNRNYRPGNGYGRQGGGGGGSGYGGGARYGNNDWTRNNAGYDNRFNNRGYQNSRARGYDRNRGYNSGWNQQNSNYGYGSQNDDTQQWYSWWQQQGGNGSDAQSQSNMQQYWSQYANQHNYGNYQQSKSHGSGSSKK